MDKSTFTKIWSVVGLALCYVTLNAVLRTQGSEVFASGVDFSEVERFSATIYGMVLSLPLLACMIWLTGFYIARHPEQPSYYRLPSAFNLQVQDPSSEYRLGKHYQRFFLWMFLILPTLAQVHLLRKFFTGTVFARQGGEPHAVGWKEHLLQSEPLSVIFSNKYLYGGEGGVTFFPFWEPWFFLICEGIVMFFFLKMIYRLYQKTPSDKQKVGKANSVNPAEKA